MKVVFYLPAHPSYFDNEYSQQEIERAVSMFQVLKPPYKIGLGEIPVEYVFLTEPGKSVTMRFDSTGMHGPDSHIENVFKIHGDDLPEHVKLIKDLLKAGQKKGQ